MAATRERSSALKTLILGTSSSLRPPFGSGPPFPINSLGRHRDSASRSSISRVLYHCEVAEGPRCPRTFQLISRSPMRFWSVGLALPPGSVSSLRRHGSFDLPHGALRCSQSRQFLPSLGLDDQRPHLRPVVAPRPLYMSSNSRSRAHPRCRCKSEARRPHGKRGRGRWGPAESTDHNASSATNARQQVFDASQGTESEPASVPSGGRSSTATTVNTTNPVDTILLFGITAPVNKTNLLFRVGWPAPSQIQRNRRRETKNARCFHGRFSHALPQNRGWAYSPCLVVVGDGICHARTTARSSRRVTQPKPRPIGRPGSQIVGPREAGH